MLDKKLEISYWKKQIDMAEEKRKKVEEISKIAAAYLKGKQHTEADLLTGKELAVVNMMFPFYKINLSSLYSRNPQIRVTAAGGNGSERAAWVLQVVATYFFKELKVKRTNKRIVGNALLKPYGVCKIGFLGATGQEVIEGEEATEDVGMLRHLFPTYYGLIKKEPKDVGIVKKSETMLDESPYIVRVKAENILIDPNASCIDEAEWVGEKYKESYDDFLKNPRYKKSVREKVRPTKYLTGSTKYEQHSQFVELVELHVKVRIDGVDQVRILVWEPTLQEDYLFDEVGNMPIDGFQYIFLNLNDFDDGEWAENSNFAILKNIQDAKNQARSNIMTMVKKFVSKVIYDKQKIQGADRQALEDGGYGSMVGCAGDPNASIKTVLNNQVPAELYQLDEKIDESWVGTSGVTRAKQLGVSEAETLGEAQIGEGAASDRTSEMSDIVDDYALEQATKFIQIIKKFLPFKTFAKIMNQMEQQGGFDFVYDWRQIGEEELRADYDVDIDTNSSRPINIMKERQEDRELLAQLVEVAPMLQTSGKVIDAWPLIRKMLRDANIRNIDEIVKDIQPPQPIPGQPGQPGMPGQEDPRQAIIQAIMQQQQGGMQ